MKGCKSWKAKQISESVFKLINQIMKHLQHHPDFHTIFQIAEPAAPSIEILSADDNEKQ